MFLNQLFRGNVANIFFNQIKNLNNSQYMRPCFHTTYLVHSVLNLNLNWDTRKNVTQSIQKEKKNNFLTEIHY